MHRYKHISTGVAHAFGKELRRARSDSGLTLRAAEEQTGIDVGQLSRFERGSFKTVSKNLQKYANHLQINVPGGIGDLEERFRRYAARSPDHRNACELMLEALERLG